MDIASYVFILRSRNLMIKHVQPWILLAMFLSYVLVTLWSGIITIEHIDL